MRVDSGFDEGDAISHWYDALIAKLIVHDADRGRAIGRLRSALARYEIAGVATNLAQLHAVAEWPAFAAGDVHTGFLDEHAPHLATAVEEPPSEAVVLLAAAELHDRAERARRAAGAGPVSPWSATDAFRLNADGFDTLAFRFGKQTLSLSVHFTRSCVTLEWNGRGAIVRDVRRDGDLVSAEVDGARLRAGVIEDGASLYVVRGPSALRFERVVEDASLGDAGGAAGALLAPLPGRITAVHVENGSRVRAGQPLVTLEAMKMEHTLVAGAAGTIESLTAVPGQQVEEGTTLLVVAAA